jgi:hypothetical protein
VSRYLRVTTALRDRDRLLAGLRALGLRVEHADPRVPLMLEGSLECAGEPVEIRLVAQRGAVEDFGFARRSPSGAFELVCGEYDKELLNAALLAPLRAELATLAARELAARDDLELETSVDLDGTRRIKLRRR